MLISRLQDMTQKIQAQTNPWSHPKNNFCLRLSLNYLSDFDRWSARCVSHYWKQITPSPCRNWVSLTGPFQSSFLFEGMNKLHASNGNLLMYETKDSGYALIDKTRWVKIKLGLTHKPDVSRIQTHENIIGPRGTLGSQLSCGEKSMFFPNGIRALCLDAEHVYVVGEKSILEVYRIKDMERLYRWPIPIFSSFDTKENLCVADKRVYVLSPSLSIVKIYSWRGEPEIQWDFKIPHVWGITVFDNHILLASCNSLHRFTKDGKLCGNLDFTFGEITSMEVIQTTLYLKTWDNKVHWISL
jgi:hypothetical protein